MPTKLIPLLQEIWQQDSDDQDLWHGPHGLIVNSAALREREEFYQLDLSPQGTAAATDGVMLTTPC